MTDPILNELSQNHLMMKVGDSIPDRPETVGELRGLGHHLPRTGKVTYIHPEGRFYCLWFDFDGGRGFSETRNFTPAEIEEGRRLGIFRMPSSTVTSYSRVPKNAPPGFRQMRESMPMNPSISLDDIDAAM